MANEWVKDKRIAATPVVMVLVLTILYGFSQYIFVQCKGGIADCEPLNTSEIAPPYSKEANDQLIARLESATAETPEKREELKNIRKLIAERHSGRLTWGFFIAFSMLLCIGTLAVSIVLIYKSSGFIKEKASLRVSIFIGLSFLLGIILWAIPNSFGPVMNEVLKNTISQGRGGMPIVFDVMRFINAFTYVASFSLIFASCLILLPREDVAYSQLTNGNMTTNEHSDDEANKHEAELSNRLGPIADQMKALRMVLYVGTLLLIVGILRMSVVTQWSLAFIQPDATDGAKTFYATLITVTGGFYTLILAALYLPAMFILQRRAQAVAKESPPLSDEEKGILDSTGFTFSLKETLPRILAILGPFLAGPIGELFSKLAT